MQLLANVALLNKDLLFRCLICQVLLYLFLHNPEWTRNIHSAYRGMLLLLWETPLLEMPSRFLIFYFWANVETFFFFFCYAFHLFRIIDSLLTLGIYVASCLFMTRFRLYNCIHKKEAISLSNKSRSLLTWPMISIYYNID